MSSINEEYMKLANSFERKKCGYLDNHVCPLRPSKARKGESCDGCSLLEKIVFFKHMSKDIEKYKPQDKLSDTWKQQTMSRFERVE